MQQQRKRTHIILNKPLQITSTTTTTENKMFSSLSLHNINNVLVKNLQLYYTLCTTPSTIHL